MRRAGGRGTWVQYRAVAVKDARQTLRDRRVMFLLVVAPLVQTILFGFAVNFDVDAVPTAVADLDQTPQSRGDVRRTLADGTLLRRAEATSGEGAAALIDRDRATLALIVPPGFGAELDAGRTARAQALVDGTDPLRATAAAGVATRAFGEAADALSAARAARAGVRLPQLTLRPRVLYNPSLQSTIYVVPGIMAMLLVVVTTIVSAMGLAREREMGTLEQVLVTPIRPFVLLAGKMTPVVAIGLFDVLLALAAITWVFGVPLRGSLPALALGSVLYLGSTLGVGLFVSTVSRTQQQAFVGGLLFLMPAALLSGVMSPIRSMPDWLERATRVNPLRFYSELVRSVLLRGAGFRDLVPQLAMLAAFAAVTLALATLRFRRRLG